MKIRFAVLFLVATSCAVASAQQRRPREVVGPDGRISVPVNPAMLEKLSELLGKDDQTEWGQMASQILRGNPNMGAGYGWYKPAQTRLTFEWLVNKYDRTRNGKVVKSELPKTITAREFRILDRNRDDSITAEDLEWKSNPTMDAGPIDQVFERFDKDSNGRLTREEMDVFFKRNADGFDFLTPADLRRALPVVPTRPRPTKEEMAKMDFSKSPLSIRFQYMEMLLGGAFGLMEEGPDVGDDAPDFELPEMINDGDFYRLKLSGEKVKLSDSKGKRPVVLIFGSFT